MLHALTDWGKSYSALVLSLCVLLVALRAELRAARNESIRSRQAIVNDIRNWANAGIALLADLANEISKSGVGTPETLGRLFALIDQGRLFFENADKNLYGLHKAPVHQGYRPRILSWLVVARKLGSTTGGYDATEQLAILHEIESNFVSDCQELILPSKLGSMTMKDLDKQFKNGSFMDVSEEHPVIIKANSFAEKEHERFRGMIL